jgi:uncharacterized protein
VILVDTGPLIAAGDASEEHHAICAELLTSLRHELVIPAPVVVEVSWLLGRRANPTAQAAFLALLGTGQLPVEPLVPADYSRAAELITTYSKLNLGAVDAAIIAVARTSRDRDVTHSQSP